MTVSTVFIPRARTIREAEAAFHQACTDRYDTPHLTVHQDLTSLNAIASVLVTAARRIAQIFPSLDMALRTCDVRGVSRPRPEFESGTVDAYALIEALFWDKLTVEAEGLLKTLLAAELVR